MPLARFIKSAGALPVLFWSSLLVAQDEGKASTVPLCYSSECTVAAEEALGAWLEKIADNGSVPALQRYAELAAKAQRSPVCSLFTASDSETPAAVMRLSKVQKNVLFSRLKEMANQQQEAFLAALPARSPQADEQMLQGDPSTGIGRLVLAATPEGSPKATILEYYRQWQPELAADLTKRELTEQTLCAHTNDVAARYANTLNLDWIFWGMRAEWFSQPRYDRYGRKLPLDMDYPVEPTATAQRLLGQALQWHLLGTWLESQR